MRALKAEEEQLAAANRARAEAVQASEKLEANLRMCLEAFEGVFEVADSQDSGLRANLVEQKSKVAMVNNAINLLNADDAEIITLFYKSEQSLEEIAQILGLETNTAKVRLHRARTRLKEKMQQHFSEEVKDIYN